MGGNSISNAVGQGFQKYQNTNKEQILLVRRKGVWPTKPFDLKNYLKKRCQHEEGGSILEKMEQEDMEEKRLIIKAKQVDLKGLKESGPKQINDPQNYPYSAVGMVYSKMGGIPKAGTGWLVGPNIVLTCAHNCYSVRTKQMHRDIQFIPSPIEKHTRLGYRIKLIYIPETYKKAVSAIEPKFNQCCLYDYAVLLLDTEHNLQEYFGSFGYDFGWQHSEQYMQIMKKGKVIEGLQMYGFKTLQFGGVEFSQYNGSAYSDQDFLIYTMKTTYGMSGAATVYRNNLNYTTAIAIHQRDVADMIEFDSIQVERKARLKLSMQMFQDIKTNFRTHYHAYSLEKKELNPSSFPKILSQIQKRERNSKDQGRVVLSLDFTDNALGDKGCQLLSEAGLTNVQELILWSNNIGGKGCYFLAKAGWSVLRILNLRKNTIGQKGCKFMIQANWNQLQRLDLWQNEIGDKGCQYLSQTIWNNLRTLNLRNNYITDKGCEHLKKSAWKNLKELNLRKNQIGDKGCQSLAFSNWNHLHLLNLRSNLIGDQGCQWLSRGEWNHLQSLDLMGNQISSQSLSFFSHLKWTVFLDS